MSIIKTILRDVEINGMKVEAEVVIGVDEDHHYDPSDWDKVDRDRVENGDLFIATVWVTATYSGIKGSDSLGGVALTTNNQFDPEPFNSDLDGTLKDYKMVENALDDLAKNIIATSNRLKQFSIQR